MRIILLSLFLVVFAFPALAAEPLIQTSARQAIVVDYETGAVLLGKNADEQMPTSSMSKTMTMYMVFDALKKGQLALSDKFTVSEKAWEKGGSKMFVEVGKEVSVEDLIRGVIVQSGNDATIVLAEGLAGTEDSFAQSLTAKAHELGMSNTNFINASGWPDPDHYSTAHDLARLAIATIRDFPDYYPYYAEEEFTFNDIKQRNRNPLLYRNIGADGIKTGHTEDGGYGLIGSGILGKRRVVLVVNGLPDETARAQESAKLLEWGLKRFENHKLFSASQVVANAQVAMGKAPQVGLVVGDAVTVTIPKVSLNEFKVTAHYKGPLVAPVQAGQEVGTLVIDVPYMNPVEVPLYAAEDVEELGLFSGAFAKAKIFLNRQGSES